MANVILDEKAIFNVAREIGSPDARAEYLRQACGSDASLLERVQVLIRAYDDQSSFLESPPITGISQTIDRPVAETPGSVIGPYKLLEQIGEGGMGTVFLAEQTHPIQRKVALKVIKPGMDSRKVIARFDAERHALALMDHPNTARVLDGGTTDTGRPFFVMELVKGVPITRYCDDHRLKPRQRLELFLPVCQAVQHAHQKGIIHRDLKPTNLLVAEYDDKPVAKVIDFGVAKATGPKLTEQTLFTEFGQVVGTLEYMSPEQAKLNALDIDTRTDIYALGVVLYELLTGTTPLPKKLLRQAAFDEVLRIIREEEPPRPSTRLSTTEDLPSIAANRGLEPRKLSGLVRGELDWIVMKALEKDRSRRYETANGLAMDLERYLTDEPVQACPPSARYRLRKFARRNRTALAMAACVLLVPAVIAVGIGWAVRDRAAREGERLAREEALDQTVARTLDETGPLIEQGQWPEALAVVERADKLLAAAGRTERPRRLLDLRKDLSTAERLEEDYQEPKRERSGSLIIPGHEGTESRSQAWRDHSEEEFFWGQQQDARFAGEFREFGVDVEALAPAEAAARIGRTRIRPALVKALDEWAAMRKRAKGDDDPFWKKLVEVARQADPDDWRNQFREALLRRDPPALEKLAAEVPIHTVPPATAYLLGLALRELGAVDRAMAVLREAHRHHPDDFWLNEALGRFSKDALRPARYDDALRYYSMNAALRPKNANTRRAVADALYYMGRVEEEIAELREAIQIKKDYAGAHNDLGVALHAKGQLDAAIGEYREAIQIKKDYAWAHNNLGNALVDKGRLDEAIAEFREAISLEPDKPMTHSNLGRALHDKGLLDEAIAECREAIRLNKDLPLPHTNLGTDLSEQGKLDEAIAEHRTAIQLDPKSAISLTSLGTALHRQGKLDEAIAEHRKAIAIDPNLAAAHENLGCALTVKGLSDEAVAELREAIRLKKDYFAAYYNLGSTLRSQGKLEEAIAGYRKALALKPDFPEAHCNLGEVLKVKGEFRQALKEFRQGHELGSKRPGWPYLSAQWVRQVERLVELDAKLPSILKGDAKSANAGECVELALMCVLYKKLNRAAAQLFAQAFAEDPRLANDLGPQHRYNAACAAALAGFGQGKDAEQSDVKDRVRLRRQALDWLRADLVAWGRFLEKEPDKVAPVLTKTMQHWQQDTDFAGVRGPEALAKLPEAERLEWQKLWADVAGTLAQAPGKGATEEAGRFLKPSARSDGLQ
jgi:serine/threonine protein kinase/Flp pilus assembly protein TadD